MDKHSAIEAAAAAFNEDQERVSGSRAKIAARKRCCSRFRAFLGRASSPEERDARLSLIESPLRSLVADVCNEYQYDNPSKLAKWVLADLRTSCGCGGDGDCEPGCECDGGNCDCNKKQATSKTAEYETGYQSETQKLEAADDVDTTTGLGGPVPEMDERSVGQVGDNLYGLDEMDVPESTRHQKTHMDADQKEPEFTSDARETGKSHSDVSKTVEADKAPGKDIVGPATSTFDSPSNTADPVTAKVVESKWGILEDSQD